MRAVTVIPGTDIITITGASIMAPPIIRVTITADTIATIIDTINARTMIDRWAAERFAESVQMVNGTACGPSLSGREIHKGLHSVAAPLFETDRHCKQLRPESLLLFNRKVCVHCFAKSSWMSPIRSGGTLRWRPYFRRKNVNAANPAASGAGPI